METTFIARTEADGKVSGQFFRVWSENAAQFLRENRFKKVHFEGKWGDMSFLSEFADCIEEVVISNEDSRADGVASLTNLNALTVHGKLKKPVVFGKLCKLERCYVSWDASYAQDLFELPNLKSLFISNYADADFQAIATSNSIEKLRLSSPKIISFNGLSKLNRLAELHIQKATSLKFFDGLAEVSGLNNLYIDGAKGVESCNALGQLSNLGHLALINVGGSAKTDFVSDLAMLRFLAIAGMPVVPDWEKVMGLKSLLNVTLLIDEENAPSIEQIKKFAAAVGKNVVQFEKNGKKGQPLIHVELCY